jgi:hypothetical protein
VDNENTDVGKKAALDQDGTAAQRPGGTRFFRQQMGDHTPVAGRRSSVHAAMSQQSSDSGRGTESLPQKLVQLVGYRDPNACREAWVRPRRVQR